MSYLFQDDRSPLSSGESGDESSGGESPGPSSSNNHIQMNSNSSETITAPRQSQDQESRNMNVNNMNSMLYPAAALANLPQEVLLGLVQAGHLQVHQEDGKFIL